MKTATVRSVRRPRHGWIDHEVFDLFGDELGPYGITVYAVLTRHCYDNFRVTMNLRELAGHARMSKDSVARSLKTMVDLGLVVEHKGPTLKSTSSYTLMDVKDLAEEVRALAKARAAASKSVSQGDRDDGAPRMGPQDAPGDLRLSNGHAESGDAPRGTQGFTDSDEELEASEASAETDADCLPQRQEAEALKKLGNGAVPETDLSQNGPRFETDLSPSASRINRQEHKNKETRTPTAAWAASILAAMAPMGIADALAAKLISRESRKANPDVSLEEILFWLDWLKDKTEQPGSTIRDPGAYVIRMVGECVAGGRYAQLKAGGERRRELEEARERERQSAQAATIAWEAYQPVAPVLADTAWRAIRGVLEQKVIRQSFETWIKPARGLDCIAGKLYVQVPSPEFQYIGEKYGDLMQEAIQEQNLQVAELRFVATPEELPWEFL
jgi:DNA-binding MarR family transcriptional regulator